jgi:polynucleotide 5'-hydroxyl-kinase GRC3/NOL9
MRQKMDGTYQVNQHWKKLASRIVKPQQVVLVIGSTDVGKSTFCRFLADFALTHGLKTAVVDADVGQSQIGPPTTIGMKFFTPEDPSVQFNGTADQLYFVGDLSPRGHYLEVLTGTSLMVDSAREIDADFIVIDTTGYIHDTPAVTLKQHKIELIRPNHIVCIGRSSELEQITACYGQQDWLNIHYLLPDRNVRSKSSKARSRYRKVQFDAYFSESTVQQLPFEQIRGGRTPFFIGRIANEKELEILSRLSETQVYHAEWGHRALCLIVSKPLSKAVITHIKNYLSLTRVTAEVRAYFERRLVGLIGTGCGNTYAIGIIEDIDFQKREFSIRCPFSKGGDAVKQACAIQFGDYQIN